MAPEKKRVFKPRKIIPKQRLIQYLQEGYIRKADRQKPEFSKSIGNSSAYLLRLKGSSSIFEEYLK